MKALAIVVCVAAVAAPAAFAQDNSDRNYPYDPAIVERGQQWQRDYDNRDYRDYRYRDRDAYRYREDYRYGDDRYRAWRGYVGRGDMECWNPRAGHFEGVREGEYQDDLDFGRCRQVGRRYGR
jgi:hypothetical protein